MKIMKTSSKNILSIDSDLNTEQLSLIQNDLREEFENILFEDTFSFIV